MILQRVRSFLRKGKEIYARIIGTRYFEKKWRSRGIDDIRKGFTNINHPHRAWVVEEFRNLAPFISSLEIGCGYGPNLITLAKEFPGCHFEGVDINPISVSEGTVMLERVGINNARLRVARAGDLSMFADKSVDIVFTDALLLYIAPDHIRQFVKELIRISRKEIFLVELHQEENKHGVDLGLGTLTSDGWIRDYRKLFMPYFSNSEISVKKIPPDAWPDGRWPDFGYLIKVHMGNVSEPSHK